jgi:hypothetical protein
MKNKTTVETKLEELKDRYWLYYEKEDGTQKFIVNDEDIEVAAELWHISPEAVKGLSESLNNAIGFVVDLAVEDLQDTWNIADCAHSNALTAMAILSEGDDCGDDDSDNNDDEPPMPNPDDCEGCENYEKSTNTCKQL